MNNKLLGQSGEDMAVKYLYAKGHEILARGFKAKTGEIDIISRELDTIHFVEVKTRTSLEYGLPREAVTPEKLKHIKNTAQLYIRKMNEEIKHRSSYLPGYKYSIDVVEVLINHIEGV